MGLSGPFDRARVAVRLIARPGRDQAVPGARRAAVAALLRWDSGEPEVLLMRRAESDGDRWSGQVSMPGGREDPGDVDLLATAVRETREELAVDLARDATLLGQLDTVQAVAAGRILPLTITPFVFAQERPVAVVGNYEVAGWFWFPLAAAARGELDGSITWRMVPEEIVLPAWQFEGNTVWGLTMRMLRQLLEVVAGDPPPG